jgi:hypothetical protein
LQAKSEAALRAVQCAGAAHDNVFEIRVFAADQGLFEGLICIQIHEVYSVLENALGVGAGLVRVTFLIAISCVRWHRYTGFLGRGANADSEGFFHPGIDHTGRQLNAICGTRRVRLRRGKRGFTEHHATGQRRTYLAYESAAARRSGGSINGRDFCFGYVSGSIFRLHCDLRLISVGFRDIVVFASNNRREASPTLGMNCLFPCINCHRCLHLLGGMCRQVSAFGCILDGVASFIVISGSVYRLAPS